MANDADVPAEIVSDMADRGFFGWSIPTEYGGLGMTTEELVLAGMELSQCSVAYRARVGTNTGIGSEALVADGTDDQKSRFLPRLASGEATGCFALTEPEAGSQASAITMSGRKDGSDYVLNAKNVLSRMPQSQTCSLFWFAQIRTQKVRGASAHLLLNEVRRACRQAIHIK